MGLRRRRRRVVERQAKACMAWTKLGIEPRASRMLSGCDTTTPCAHLIFASEVNYSRWAFLSARGIGTGPGKTNFSSFAEHGGARPADPRWRRRGLPHISSGPALARSRVTRRLEAQGLRTCWGENLKGSSQSSNSKQVRKSVSKASASGHQRAGLASLTAPASRRGRPPAPPPRG